MRLHLDGGPRLQQTPADRQILRGPVPLVVSRIGNGALSRIPGVSARTRCGRLLASGLQPDSDFRSKDGRTKRLTQDGPAVASSRASASMGCPVEDTRCPANSRAFKHSNRIDSSSSSTMIRDDTDLLLPDLWFLVCVGLTLLPDPATCP